MTASDKREIEVREIQKTRNQMGQTVDAIEEKLSPARLKEQVLEQIGDARVKVREEVQEQLQQAKTAVRDATIGKVENMARRARTTVNDTGATVTETIRANPIPAVMVGLGLGWLFLNAQRQPARRPVIRARNERYDYDQLSFGDRKETIDQNGHDGSGMLGRATEAAGQVAERAQEKASSVIQSSQEAVRNIGNRAQEMAHGAEQRIESAAGEVQVQARRVEARFAQALQDNPLAVAAAALAVGTAIGLSIPETRKEDELMGEARDRLMGKAGSAASEALEKAKTIATDKANVPDQANVPAKAEEQKETEGKGKSTPTTTRPGL